MPTDPVADAASGLFPRTAWSRIQASSQDEDVPGARQALDEICQRYWKPAFVFLRSLGCGVDDAEDITQQFFAHWARPEKLGGLTPEKGRLRTYLKTALRRHFYNHWRAQQRLRRGGGQKPAALDEIGDVPSGDDGAELQYDVAWADAVLDAVMGHLRDAYEGRGRVVIFDALAEGLPGGAGLKPYPEIAATAGMKEAQVKIEMHRLRRRFAEKVRAEVAETLNSSDELEDELRYLLRVMAHAHGDPS